MPIWHKGGRANPPLQAPCHNVGTTARKTEAQGMPLLHWHKLGSEKQCSAENWEPQISLNPSSGKHVGLQGKGGRKWDYLKPPILKGMATNSDLWPKYHWVGCSPWGCSGTGWGRLLLPGQLMSSEQSRGCCKQDFGLQGGVSAFGTKQPLWSQDVKLHRRQMSSSHREAAKLTNTHLPSPYLSKANLAF